MVYDQAGLDWRNTFEPDFTRRFNGLMLRGGEEVHTVYCAVLPTPQVLTDFLRLAQPGDMFFTHHPIDFEMGDPQGQPGRGPLPIETPVIERLLSRRLSFYACHAPLDYNRSIGTGLAIEKALGALFQKPIYPAGSHFYGSVCAVPATSTSALVDKLKSIFAVPYVDFIGIAHQHIDTVAIVPGSADKVEVMQEAEAGGAQALISGEVCSHRADDYGRAKHAKVMEYLPRTTMSLIGVSHGASEHLVMETHMVQWFEHNCRVQARTIRMEKWWR
jgi:putative NIF3 family GTP cyclohydrolase 1 type 2